MGVLSGQRIVVTRAAHQAEELAAPLRELGAEVILLPLLAIGPPKDTAAFEKAAARLSSYDWLIFTSTNAVRAFAAALPPRTDRAAIRVATVGPATRKAAEEAGFRVTLTPAVYQAEALAGELAQYQNAAPNRVLIPGSEIARDTVPVELRRLGFEVTVVEAYRNICPPEAREQATRIFRSPLPHWVLLASPSAAQNLVWIIGVNPLVAIKIGSIGKATSEAVRSAGLKVTVQADPQTIPGLVEAVAAYRRSLSNRFAHGSEQGGAEPLG